jgi:hypothetical protein
MIAYFYVTNSAESPGVKMALEQKVAAVRPVSPSSVATVFHASKRRIPNSNLIHFVRIPVWPRQLIHLVYPLAIWLRVRKMPPIEFLVLRAGFPSPLMRLFFNKRKFRLVTEHHTLLFQEVKLLLNLPSVFFQKLYKFVRRANDSVIDGKLCVTQEIADAEHFSGGIFVSGNLIGGRSRGRRKPITFSGETLNIAMPSSRNFPWHGEDRLIESAQHWVEESPQLDVQLWFFGTAGPSEQPHPRVRVWRVDRLGSEDLSLRLEQMHLGASSLALFRKCMQDASPLKSRFFVSQRLPFLYGYTDPDIEPECPVTLQVSNKDEVIPWSEVQQFLHRVAESDHTPDWDTLQWRLSSERKTELLVEFLHEL